MKKGSHHNKETLEKQRLAKLGKPAHPNTVEATRRRMLENNPMKNQKNRDLVRKRMVDNNPMRNPDVAARSGDGKKGKSHSKDRRGKERMATIAAQTDEVRAKKSASHVDKPLSQEHCGAISRGKKGESRTFESRVKLSCTRRGIPTDSFTGFVSFEPYCERFNENLRERVRCFQGNVCALCGKSAEQNITKRGNVRNLSVHHVFIEKLACCETRIAEMDSLRKRLPPNIACFGNATFSEEETKYIQMMVPLCFTCHGKMNSEPDSIEYEESVYRKYFAETIMSKYQGRCYFTREEFSKLLKTDS